MTRRALVLAAVALLVTALVALAGLWLNAHSVVLDLSKSPAPTSTVRVRCTPPSGPLPAALATDPCPSARLAVELAVAPVRLPIEAILIEPGNFSCGLFWPGAQSPPLCYGGIERPGQYMHAWVSFTGSAKVAVVVLGLNLPDDIDAPGTTRPPWQTTLLAVEVPPSGWVMP
jgi:hypothetical protein